VTILYVAEDIGTLVPGSAPRRHEVRPAITRASETTPDSNKGRTAFFWRQEFCPFPAPTGIRAISDVPKGSLRAWRSRCSERHRRTR
jgi:hypothetical protein